MINTALRQKFTEQQKNKQMTQGITQALMEGFQNKGTEDTVKMIFEKKDDEEVKTQLGKIGQAMVMIYRAVSKPIILPKIFQIKGQVEVTKQPPVKVDNFSEMKKYFDSLEDTMKKLYLAIQAMPQPQIKLPKIEVPAQVSNSSPDLLQAITDLGDKIENIQPAEIKIPKTVEVSNFPQQYIPTPVTNFSINPLQGVVKTTSTTVGTTVTPLPGYGRLFNRRAMVIYNNSSNTIYYGGSDVTTANGIPLASGDFSSVFDAGYNQIIYGIAATNGNDIRVLESAAKSEGGVAVQE